MGSLSKTKNQKKSEANKKTSTTSTSTRAPQIRKNITAKVDSGKVRRRPKKRTQKTAVLSPQTTLTRLKQSRYELIKELDSIREILKEDSCPNKSISPLISGDTIKRNQLKNNNPCPALQSDDSREWGVIFGRKIDLHQRPPDMLLPFSQNKSNVLESVPDLGGKKSNKLLGAEGSIVNVQEFAQQFSKLCERFKKHAPPAELQFLEQEQKRICSMLNKVEVKNQKQIANNRLQQNRHVGAQAASLKNGLGKTNDMKSFKIFKTNKISKEQLKSDLVVKADVVKQSVLKSRDNGKQKRLLDLDGDSTTEGSTTESLYNYNRYNSIGRDGSLVSTETAHTSLYSVNADDGGHVYSPNFKRILLQNSSSSPGTFKTSTSNATTEEEEEDEAEELTEAGSEEDSTEDSGSEVTSDSSSSPRETINRPKIRYERFTNPYETINPANENSMPKPGSERNKAHKNFYKESELNEKQAAKVLKNELKNIKQMKSLMNGSKKSIKGLKSCRNLEPIKEESTENMSGQRSQIAEKTSEDKTTETSEKDGSLTRKVRFADDVYDKKEDEFDEIKQKKITLTQGQYQMDLLEDVLSDADKKVRLTESVCKWTEISRSAADAALEKKKIQNIDYVVNVDEFNTAQIQQSGDFEFNSVKFVEPLNYPLNMTTEVQSPESGDHEYIAVENLNEMENKNNIPCTQSKLSLSKTDENNINADDGNKNWIEENKNTEIKNDRNEISCKQSKSSIENVEEQDMFHNHNKRTTTSVYRLSILKSESNLVSCEEGDSDDDWRNTKIFKYTKERSAGSNELKNDNELSSQQHKECTDEKNQKPDDIRQIGPILKQAMEKLYKNELEFRKQNEVDISSAYENNVKQFTLNSNILNSISTSENVVTPTMSKSAPALQSNAFSSGNISKYEKNEKLESSEALADSKSSAILPLECEFYASDSQSVAQLARFCHETLENFNTDTIGCSEILEPVFDISPLRSEIDIETKIKHKSEEEKQEYKETIYFDEYLNESKKEKIEEINRSSDITISDADDDSMSSIEQQNSHVDVSYYKTNCDEIVEDTMGQETNSSSSSIPEPYIVNFKNGYAWERLGLLEQSQIDSQQLLRNLESSIENMKSGLLKLAEACDRKLEKTQKAQKFRKTKKLQGFPTLSKKSIIPISAWPMKFKNVNRDENFRQVKHTSRGMKSELETFYQELMSDQPTTSQITDESSTFKITENEASSALRLTGDIIARAYEERYGGNPRSFHDMSAIQAPVNLNKCETNPYDWGKAGKTFAWHLPLDVVKEKEEFIAFKDNSFLPKAPMMFMPLLCVPNNAFNQCSESQSNLVPVRQRNYDNVFKENFGKFAEEVYPAKLEPTNKSGYEYFCTKFTQEHKEDNTTGVIAIQKQNESCQMNLFQNPYESQEYEQNEKSIQQQKYSPIKDANIPDYSGCPCMFNTYEDILK